MVINQHFIRNGILSAALLALVSCGGGSGGIGSTIGTGKIVGYTISGLPYRSGDISGVTDEAGNFQFETGSDIEFFIGDTIIGSITSGEVIFYEDIVGQSSILDSEVINVTRYLLSLDEDNNSENGIQIPQSIVDIADTFIGVPFNNPEFDSFSITQLQQISDAIELELALVDEIEAIDYLEQVQGCLASGLYAGGFTSGNAGDVYFIFDSGFGIGYGPVQSSPSIWAIFNNLRFGQTINFDAFDFIDVILQEDQPSVSSLTISELTTLSGVNDVSSFELDRLNTDFSADLQIVGGVRILSRSIVEILYSINISVDGRVTGTYIAANLADLQDSVVNTGVGIASLDFDSDRITGSLNDDQLSFEIEGIPFEVTLDSSRTFYGVTAESSIEGVEPVSLFGNVCNI